MHWLDRGLQDAIQAVAFRVVDLHGKRPDKPGDILARHGAQGIADSILVLKPAYPSSPDSGVLEGWQAGASLGAPEAKHF